MMFWNKTITLYNRFEDAQTGIIKWYRHRLENCFYKSTYNTSNTGTEQIRSEDMIIRIPEQGNYLAKYKWIELSDSERCRYMTLQSGDLIVLGDITDSIDEYTAGKRSSDLFKKHSAHGAILIRHININDFLPGAHYLVKGR